MANSDVNSTRPISARELREYLAHFEDDALIFVNVEGGKAPVVYHTYGTQLQRRPIQVPVYVSLSVGDVIAWDPT